MVFEQTSSQIALLDDEIALRVEKDSIIQSINLSGEGLKINVSKMDISGLVTISALSTQGQTVIHGGSIMTDTILADSLLVNSLSAISANLGTINAGTINGVNINGSVFTASGGSKGVVTIGSGEIESDYNGTYCRINSGVLSVGTYGVSSSGYLAQVTPNELFISNPSINQYAYFSADRLDAVSGGGSPRRYDMKANFYFSGSVDFSNASVSGLTVPYATSAGNADTLDGLNSSDFSLSGHVHSGSQYVKPSSGQAITLGASATQLNVYVNGLLQGSIPYA